MTIQGRGHSHLQAETPWSQVTTTRELGSPQVSQVQKEAGTEPKTAPTRWDPRKGGAWPAKSPTHRVWGQTRVTSCQVPRMDAVGTLTSPALWVESDISAARRQTSVWRSDCRLFSHHPWPPVDLPS